MSTAPTAPAVVPTADSAEPRSGCPVCDHDLTIHDTVSRRYCLATQARALSRDCICNSFSTR